MTNTDLILGWQLIGTVGVPPSMAVQELELGLTTMSAVRIRISSELDLIQSAGWIIATTAGYQIGRWQRISTNRDLLLFPEIQHTLGTRWLWWRSLAIPASTQAYLYQKDLN